MLANDLNLSIWCSYLMYLNTGWMVVDIGI